MTSLKCGSSVGWDMVGLRQEGREQGSLPIQAPSVKGMCARMGVFVWGK